jgi:hypothetical protein
MIRAPGKLVVLLFVCLAGGCRDVTEPEPITGLYRLLAVDGATLPALLELGTGTESVRMPSGQLVLDAGGSFTLALRGEPNFLPPSTFTATGTWTLDDTRLHLTSTDAQLEPPHSLVRGEVHLNARVANRLRTFHFRRSTS